MYIYFSNFSLHNAHAYKTLFPRPFFSEERLCVWLQEREAIDYPYYIVERSSFSSFKYTYIKKRNERKREGESLGSFLYIDPLTPRLVKTQSGFSSSSSSFLSLTFFFALAAQNLEAFGRLSAAIKRC
jgi:hypothetical protein